MFMMEGATNSSGSAELTQGPNLYEYVWDNPINRLDPTGLQEMFTPEGAATVAEVNAVLDPNAAAAAAAEAAEAAAAKAAAIARCEAIYAAYKSLSCKTCSCKKDTKDELQAKIFCLTGLVALRTAYLAFNCDYVLAGSIRVGSARQALSHYFEAARQVGYLATCEFYLSLKG
jgi:hypothetical protein